MLRHFPGPHLPSLAMPISPGSQRAAEPRKGAPVTQHRGKAASEIRLFNARNVSQWLFPRLNEAFHGHGNTNVCPGPLLSSVSH